MDDHSTTPEQMNIQNGGTLGASPPIFIIGIARSGTTFLMNALNNHPLAHLLTEVHYSAPRWVRRDFRHLTRKVVPIAGPKDLDTLLQIMYSGDLPAVFWHHDHREDPDANRITSISRQRLEQTIRATGPAHRDILLALMRVASEQRGKQLCGAKVPFDIAHTNKLLEWYPGARLIHSIRDPRAIYASMVRGEIKDFDIRSPLKQKFVWAKRFAYLVSRYRWAAKVHRNLRGRTNYFLSRYEDRVCDPSQELAHIAQFLTIPFCAALLEPEIKNTSYQTLEQQQIAKKKAPVRGVSQASLETWRSYLPVTVSNLISRTLKSEMNLFGYNDTGLAASYTPS